MNIYVFGGNMEKDTGKAKTLELLLQAGLPQFELGDDGYPIPGRVVKYYREQMKYTDRDGKVKHWTQADLAQRLGVTEIMVNIMENQNKGLDSIERRRALATILRIPPVLLGLGSLDLIVEIVAGKDAITPKQASTKRPKISKDVLKQYQSTLDVYGKMYAQGVTYAVVDDVDKWTVRLTNIAKNAQTEDRGSLLQILYDYEILCASIHGSDLQEWSNCFEHIDNAFEIAVELNNKDLQAACLYLKSVYHLRQGRVALARIDLDGALMYTKGASPQTKGAIYNHDARLYAKDTSVASGTTIAQKLLDQAEHYIGAPDEATSIKFSKGVYFLNKASLLIDIKRTAKALELIDDAEGYGIPKRYSTHLNMLRAKCYIEQRKPEYEQAVRLLVNAIEDSKELQVARNVDQIEKLYRKLTTSSYGNAPEVIDLGLALQDLRMKTI